MAKEEVTLDEAVKTEKPAANKSKAKRYVCSKKCQWEGVLIKAGDIVETDKAEVPDFFNEIRL